jgi:transposase
MAYREVMMLEVKEVLRLWLAGVPKRQVAAQLGLDVKTVRRYLSAAQASGLRREQGAGVLDEALVASVLAAVRPILGRPRGDGWALCESQRSFIQRYLGEHVRLSKVGKLLARQGTPVAYPTLRRFAMAELGFGRTAPTVPVADCGAGEELQLDTGWMTLLEPDLFGKRRRFRAWIFTAVLSRHRFVYPVFRETTVTAIEACEAAWAFYGGVFKAVIPDNTKAIVQTADPLAPRLTAAFLEYAQARGFVVDTTRVRSPKDKARVERAVQTVRDDCFAGEHLHTIEQARDHARGWCERDYGMRRHTRTQRLPKEHFEAEEQKALLPAPTEPYDVPLWCEPKVARDHFAQVAKALYTLPTRYIGKTLRARADRAIVRFYDGAALVKVHARQSPGGKSIDPSDFPPEKAAYAMRDVAFLQREAARHGDAVGRFAKALLDGPLPWTRMRHVYALLGLCRRYGDARVEETSATALAVEMTDVRRLTRMLARAAPLPPPPTSPQVIPLARYLRPPSQYALPLASRERDNEGDDP